MKAYAAGNMEAFEALYQRYREPLYRYIMRRTGDSTTANDLYQGSWEKIVRARRRYRAKTPFRAWMFRIAHNHVVDWYRKSRPAADLLPETIPADGPGPEEILQEEARRSQLKSAMLQLPAEQLDALLLKLEAGLDLQTIADVVGANRETVKSRLRYAVAKLKSIIPEEAGN